MINHYKSLLSEIVVEIINQEDFSNLDKEVETLNNINFKNGEFYTKLHTAKQFNSETVSQTTSKIESAEAFYKKIKLISKKDDLVQQLTQILLNETATQFETPNSDQDYEALKREYELFKTKSQSEIEAVKKENTDLKQQNQKLEKTVEESKKNNESSKPNTAPLQQNPKAQPTNPDQQANNKEKAAPLVNKEAPKKVNEPAAQAKKDEKPKVEANEKAQEKEPIKPAAKVEQRQVPPNNNNVQPEVKVAEQKK